MMEEDARETPIILIASVAKNRVIGKDGSQPLYIKGDLKHFQSLTTGHVVVMGRKTYESILSKLGKPLPKRMNVVVTREKEFDASGCMVCHSVEEALRVARQHAGKVYVIGGQQLFEQTLPFADVLELTEIDADLEGDVYFPEFSTREWKEVSRGPLMSEGGVSYSFATYKRIR